MNARQYLAVPYSEKDRAKSLGAKWDADSRLWYAESDFSKFERWSDPGAVAKLAKHKQDQVAGIAHKPVLPKHKQPRKNKRREAYQEKMRQGFVTPRTDHSLPDCGCLHIAPWDECDHSMPWPVLDADQAEHMKSIAKEQPQRSNSLL